MANYKIFIKKSAEKEIRKLEINVRRRVVNRIHKLATQPRGSGTEKLSSREAYRVRVGVYRIVYTIQDNILIVEVIKVAHRREVYR
jgi:mRNA interferase RelE/StbE